MASFPPSKKRPLSIITEADRAALEEHYEFIPSENKNEMSSWQQRMVQHYHQHLYKEYALADFTRKPQLGLRWRTKTEVESGRGSVTCGNKHCPAPPIPMDPREEKRALEMLQSTSQSEAQAVIAGIPAGLLMRNFEVPFTYQERNEEKQELVKLHLCLRCSMLLFECRKETDPALAVYESWMSLEEQDPAGTTAPLSSKPKNDERSTGSSSRSSKTDRKKPKKQRKHRKSAREMKRSKHDN
ncbi:protein FRA10AC1 [Fistulifera solaris]|uniref:Protein FRA10AC1 n=1 Tax=Fistulifera solaris TaxID=1519565 RepID=A0A1Z5KSC0_FISSO|nr:protein FRA10AC1 [Fistulifera solaris]|eukprot:GAX28891.1 protein FRA10AC1 [Fistulifera solaris]